MGKKIEYGKNGDTVLVSDKPLSGEEVDFYRNWLLAERNTSKTSRPSTAIHYQSTSRPSTSRRSTDHGSVHPR